MSVLVFQHSEKAISQRKEILRLLQWLLPIIFVAFVFLLPEMRRNIFQGIMFVGIGTLIFEIEFYFIWRFITNRMRQIKFSVTPEFIERSANKSVERINFNEIRSLQIVENPTEHLIVATISSHKAPMTLSGIDDIEILLDQLKNGIVDKSIIHRKTSKFVTYNLTRLIIWMAIAVGVVPLMLYLDKTVFLIFELLLFLFSGLFIIIYRPLTRTLGSSHRILELVMGIVLELCFVGMIYLVYIR